VTISISVPEPSSFALLFLALVVLIAFVMGKTRPAMVKRLLLAFVGALLVAGSAHAAVTPVQLYTVGAASSVWDTDPSKVGVELQIGNNGTSDADNVQVTSVTVQGGSLGGPSLPVVLGTIGPQES